MVTNYQQILLILLISYIMSTVKGQESPECFEEGECMDSLMLDFLHDVPDVQTCLDACQHNSDCEYFTFLEEENSCLLLANCIHFSTDSCSGCYSGNRSCEDLHCWDYGLCDGEAIEESNGVDRDVCLNMCQSNEECQWFTHDMVGGTCLMFNSCVELNTCATCLSSQKLCSYQDSNPGYSKLLIVGGYDTAIGSFNLAEAVDLANPANTCDPIADYPIEATGMALGVMDGIVKSCGSHQDTAECYDYDPTADAWIQSASMLTAREVPKASFIDGIWLVSGDNPFEYAQSSEIWTGSAFEQGPFIPNKMLHHCQLTINSTHIFFLQDYTELGATAFLLNWYTQTWTSLPAYTRVDYVNPSCGLLNNPDNGPEVVVTMDGTSHIFNFKTMTWRDGPGFEDTFIYASSAQVKDTFVLVGGHSYDIDDSLNTIYMFDHFNYDWILMEQQLEVRRGGFPGVIAVPDSFVSCTK